MIANDDELIGTRREAWLCAIGLALSVVALPAFIALLVFDSQRTVGVLALVIALGCLLGGQLALAFLWHLRHLRRPDLFPGWAERHFSPRWTPVSLCEHARYPTSYWCARQLLRAAAPAERLRAPESAELQRS